MYRIIDKELRIWSCSIADLTMQQVVPVLNIPMMSDERWNQLAAEQKEKRKRA